MPTMNSVRSLCVAVLAAGFFLLMPGEAFAQCKPGWALCPDSLGGGCAPRGATCCPGGRHVTSGACPSDTPGSYGAAAASLYRDSRGVAHVATGISWDFRTLAEASAAAIKQCKGQGGTNCRVVDTFSNGGCGYIATGASRTAAAWATGATPQEALNKCRQGGYNCKQPVGGCTVRR